MGSENRNLPGFVVLSFGVVPCGGLENYSNGFLPASNQASLFNADGIPIENIQPADKDQRIQLAKLALLRGQDESFSRTLGVDDTIESAIKNYEMAYRMQSLVPDLLDLGRETEETQKLYGLDSAVPSKRLYGIQCLRARRLIESGVRFVEITCPPGASNGTWDQHGDLKKGHEKNALDTDQAIAGLIHEDLKQQPGCWMKPWSCGPANSAELRIREAATGAIIIRKACDLDGGRRRQGWHDPGGHG